MRDNGRRGHIQADKRIRYEPITICEQALRAGHLPLVGQDRAGQVRWASCLFCRRRLDGPAGEAARERPSPSPGKEGRHGRAAPALRIAAQRSSRRQRRSDPPRSARNRRTDRASSAESRTSTSPVSASR